MSNYLHDEVEQGDVLDIGPPCGEFTLDPAAVGEPPVVLLSGGIGVTPLMSMLKSLAHHEVRTPVYFIHAARNSRVHALAAEVRRASEGRRNFSTHVRYDAPLPEDLDDRRCDSAGLLDLALLEELLPTNDVEYYFCGPPPLWRLCITG